MGKVRARDVRCYHCGRAFEVSARAMTVSCPGCFKPVLVEDIVIRSAQGNTTLQTCGRLVVQRRGRVTARRIQAVGGVEMLGQLKANVESMGEVRIGAGATWSGDCRAPALRLEPGATISGGFFAIGPGANGAGANGADAAR